MGLYRLMLAGAVVLGHVRVTPNLGAGSAVWGFYVLSGALMWHAITRYAPGPRGALAFYGNRLLRLGPPYLAAWAGAALVVLGLPDPAGSIMYPSAWQLEGTGWLLDILLMADPEMPRSRLVPPTWSLYVEGWWYLAVPVVAAVVRTPLVGAVATLAAGLASASVIAAGDGMRDWYHGVVPAAGAFALGAVIAARAPRVPLGVGAVLLVAWGAWVALWGGDRARTGWALLWTIPMHAGIVAAVLRSRVPAGLEAADRWAGRLAYGVFLWHWPATACVGAYTTAPLGTWPYAAVTVVLTLGLAFATWWTIERPVERWRTALRAQ